MSLLTDLIFVKALRSNHQLISILPDGDVHNTSIAVPDEKLEDVNVPYVIVSYDEMENEDGTKDNLYEGFTDKVQVSVEVAANSREELASIMRTVRTTIKNFFISAQPTDDDYNLIPNGYRLSASAVSYMADKPCYWQVLLYQCDTNIDEDEQESN